MTFFRWITKPPPTKALELAAASRYEPTWLCPRPVDRQRVIEMEERLAPAYRLMRGLLPASLLAAAMWLGPWALLPALVGIASALLTPRIGSRVHYPEYAVAGMAIGLLVAFGLASGLTGGLTSPLTYWMLVPTCALPARFRTHVVVSGLGFGLIVLLGSCALFAPESFGANLTNPILLVSAGTACAVLTGIIASAEYRHRESSLLDPLTGVLNRNSLKTRQAEISEQARNSGADVSVIACDLDHFKQVNDTYGHAVGDQVLRETADAMRANLRSFELLYRIGGEEFLVLLPGAALEHSMTIAEGLRERVARAAPAGIEVTMSVGVSSASGPDVEFPALYQAADRALYAAKRQGRNRVVADVCATDDRETEPRVTRPLVAASAD